MVQQWQVISNAYIKSIIICFGYHIFVESDVNVGVSAYYNHPGIYCLVAICDITSV